MTEEELLAGLRPACICKGIKMRNVIQAIEDGAQTFEAVSALTGIGGGSCKSRRCKEKIKRILNQTAASWITLDTPQFEKDD